MITAARFGGEAPLPCGHMRAEKVDLHEWAERSLLIPCQVIAGHHYNMILTFIQCNEQVYDMVTQTNVLYIKKKSFMILRFIGSFCPSIYKHPNTLNMGTSLTIQLTNDLHLSLT